MNTTVSRRALLRAVPVASTAGLSGCFGSDGGSTGNESEPSCTMFDQESEKHSPLRNTKVVPWDGDSATLRVTLVRSELEETGAKWINVYEPEITTSSPKYTIPINVGDIGPTDTTGDEAVVYKEHAIGSMPVSGRFRIEIADDDTTLAWEAFSFDCSSETA